MRHLTHLGEGAGREHEAASGNVESERRDSAHVTLDPVAVLKERRAE